MIKAINQARVMASLMINDDQLLRACINDHELDDTCIIFI